MTVTVRYIGTTNPYFETAVTGKPGKWTPGDAGDVSDVDAALLIATSLFEVYADRVMPFVVDSTGAIVGARDPSGAVKPISSSGVSVSGIDSLTAADGNLEIVVPGTQAGTPRVLRKATLRPSQMVASYAALLAIPSPQLGDEHYTQTGVLGNMRPTRWVYDGTRYLPVGPADWNYTSVHDSDALIVRRTTAGAFALPSTSIQLCTFPANSLRVGSHFEGELIVRRTGTTTASVPVQLRLGTTPSAVIGTDNMSGTAVTEARFIFSFGFSAAGTVYSSFFSGIGNNQPVPNQVADAQFDFASLMALGVYLNGSDTDSTFAVQSLRLKGFV